MATIVTRASKGSPLTNTEVDANFTNLNTDKAELSGATFTGEIVANAGIALGDNDKATFGAGDDLQIYHDGSHSYIQDVGQGNLNLVGANIVLKGQTSGQWLFSAYDVGATTLYHQGSPKLATTSTGIDVTGSVVADGLTVGASTPKLTLQDTDGTNQTLEILTSGSASYYRARNNTANGQMLFGGYGGGTFDEHMRIDSSGKVGINTSSPERDLHVNSGGVQIGALFQSTSTNSSRIALIDANTTSSSKVGIGAIGDTLNLYSGGSIGVTVDATSNVGIGTSSPSEALEVYGLDPVVKVTQNSGAAGHATLTLGSAGSGGRAYNIISGDNGYSSGSGLHFEQADGLQVTMKNSGNVGIGTSSPASSLHVKKNDGILVESTSAANYGVYIESGYAETMGAVGALSQHDGDRDGASISFGEYGRNLTFNTGEGSNNAERMRISSAGNVGIGTNSPARALHVNSASGIVGTIEGSTSTSFLSFNNSSLANDSTIKLGADGNNLTFYANSAERMRIDSSGHVLVGTSSVQGAGGVTLAGTGYVYSSRPSSTAIYADRTGSDGAIQEFRKGGTTVGSIGTSGGDMFAGTGDTGLRFVNADNAIVPWNTSTNAGRDNAIDLGKPSERFKDLYLSGNANVDGTVEFNGLSGTGAVTVTDILDEDNMASNSATALATQQSIKAYVDANAGGGSGDITAVTAGSGLTGGGTSGAVTLNVIGGSGITANANDISLDNTVIRNTGAQTKSGQMNFSDVVRVNNTNAVLRLTAGTSNPATIQFGDSGDFDIGKISYANADNSMAFTTNTGERARITSGGNLGIGLTAPSQALHVVGNVVATGNITANFSDERLKDFKGTIPDALDKVAQLNGYYYTPNKTAQALGVDNNGVEVGVSAQEVEAVLPEIIADSVVGKNYKTVMYERLTPLLIEAVKELTQKLEKLELKLNEMEK